MNKFFTILIAIFVVTVKISLAQTISFTDIDVTAFPKVSTSFMALDKYGDSYPDITAKDFNVFENGIKIPSNLLQVNCKISPMKVVLVLDKSTSMQDIPAGQEERLWDWVVEGANTFINDMQYTNGSEVALTAFAGESYFKCDFTNDKKLLYDSIKSITPYGKTNMNKAFFGPFTGAIELLQDQPSNFRRIIVFLSDGKHDDMQDGAMLVDSISNSLLNNNIQLYSITLFAESNPDLSAVSVTSGGNYYNVSTKKALNNIYATIANAIKDRILCTLSWPTAMVCDDIERWKIATIEYLRHNKQINKLYQVPEHGVAVINTDEKTYKFGNPSLGSYTDIKIKLTPENADAAITNISVNPSTYFTVIDYGFGEGVSPSYPINLTQNSDYYVTVRFTPQSLKTFRKANLVLQGNPCPLIVPMIGGIPEINVDNPLAGNFFSKCDSVEIKWSGVDAFTPTDLFYSLNGGSTWTLIEKGVKGNLYKWKPGFDHPNIMIKAEVSPTQTYVWAMSGGGKQADIANGIALSNDQLGIYVCGYLSSSAVFSEKYIPNFGNTDAFLVKYDTDGNLKWIQTGGGKNQDSAFSVCVDNQDNIYTTGVCHADSRFGNITPLTPIYSSPYVFIAKYDSDGNTINANTFGANGTYNSFRAWGRYIRTAGNNIQVIADYTGEFKGGSINLPQTNTPRQFTLTYDKDLNLISVFAGGTIQKVTKVTDKDKFTYSITNFVNFMDFDRYTVKSEGNYDVAVTKFGQSSEGFDISEEFTLYSPMIKPQSPSLDLGICLVGDTCMYDLADFIENIGNVPAKITGFTVTSSVNPQYLMVDSTIIGTMLNPTEKTNLKFSINSYVRGLYEATLKLTGDCGEEIILPIKCNINCETKTIDTIDFGQVFINSQKSMTINCLVENLNGIDLPINPLIQGKNANEFFMKKLQVDTAFHKQCYNIEITFNPRQLGERTARVNLSMKDPCGEQIIYIRGVGINPSAVLPDEIDWRVRRINKNYDSIVTMYNPTTASMWLQDIYFSKSPNNGEFADLNKLTFPIELKAQDTTKIPVTFLPKDDVYYESEITYKILNKDSVSLIPVKLKGTGFYPQMEYTWSCGSPIKPNDSTLAVLTIKNTSDNSELSIDRIRLALNNGIYVWENKIEPKDEKILPNQSKDFNLNFYPKDISPNLNSIIIMADDFDGTFTDFWKETRFNINCQAVGINFPDKHNFGTQLICSTQEFKVKLENTGSDTDIQVDFSKAGFSGIYAPYFTIKEKSIVVLKPSTSYEFSVYFSPIQNGKYTTTLNIPNNFGIDIKIDFEGIGSVMKLYSDKKSYSQIPGKTQEITFGINGNKLDYPITDLSLQIIYNKKQIKFDTTYFENIVQAIWTWDKPEFNTNGTIDITSFVGSLPGDFIGNLFKMKFTFLLDTGLVSDLIILNKLNCQDLYDTCAVISTSPVCVDFGRKIFAQINPNGAILEFPSPNPAVDQITLKFTCGKESNIHVKLFNTMGVEVATLLNKKYNIGLFEENISLKDIQSGVYILEFFDGHEKTIEKITITK